LMTPILKAYLTEKGYDHATNAQQVLGGHGYIKEWGMEQFVRDARIAMIYEGANGIQALDLVGRKLMKDGGRAWQAYFKEIDDFIADHGDKEELKLFVEGLADSKAKLMEATQWMGANAMQNFDQAGAGSMDYLHLFALTALAFSWAQMASISIDSRDGDETGFYENKLLTGKYFMERMLPDTGAHLAKIKSGSETMMGMPADAF